MTLRLAVIVVLAAGCGSPEAPTPTVAPSPPPAAPPSAPALPAPQHPEGAIAIPCTVRAEIEPTLVRDELRLRFMLVNLGTETQTVTLRGTCPGGVVELQGLPTTFDPMHRCQAGACPSPEVRETYTVAPKKAVTIGETTLRAKGDACNPALPLGSTFLQAAIATEPQAFDVCGGGMVHIVRDPRTGTLRRAGLLDDPVPAVEPQPKTTPTPTVTRKVEPTRPRKQCPACGIGCPHGIPSSKIGPDGCPSCSCENFEVTVPRN